MSIVRVGLSESKDYGEGWSAVFGKGSKASKPAKASAAKKKSKPKKKKKS